MKSFIWLLLGFILFCNVPAQAQSIVSHDLVFLGDSHTAFFDWQRSLPQYGVINAGVPKDSTAKVLQRLPDVFSLERPLKLFIMIGINDLWHSTLLRRDSCVASFLRIMNLGVMEDELINSLNNFYWLYVKIPESMKNYYQILWFVREQSPGTLVFVQGILPVNNNLFLKNTADRIDASVVKVFNDRIQRLTKQACVMYVDLYPFLIRESQLKEEYTYDGVHLNEQGNTAWLMALAPYILLQGPLCDR